jgi:GNAT superfamily N-acetyltransferase
MKIELIDNPAQDLIDFLDQRINDFNQQNWEVKQQIPIAVKVSNEEGEIIAGAAGRTFGDWFLLDTLWVSESLRGKHLGSQLLNDIEIAACNRGCKKALLDTLNFQAMPFYQQQGYSVEWTQEGYPRTGCKYFMVKTFANI